MLLRRILKNQSKTPSEIEQKIRQLIKNGVGDVGRLSYILESLKKKKPLYQSDQRYLSSLLKYNIENEKTKSSEKPQNKIDSVKSLIESGIGDVGRLCFIHKTMSEGKQLAHSDQQYLEDKLGQTIPASRPYKISPKFEASDTIHVSIEDIPQQEMHKQTLSVPNSNQIVNVIEPENLPENTIGLGSDIWQSKSQQEPQILELKESIEKYRKEYEKIKSLISESQLLLTKLQRQHHEALRELTNTNTKLTESKFELKNIIEQHQLQKEEITKMKKQYDQTFTKLTEIRAQLEIIDNQYKEKKLKLSEIQTSFVDTKKIDSEVEQPKETQLIELNSTQDLSTDESKPEEFMDVFQVYSDGLSNYVKWLNEMISSYYQSINDFNQIAVSKSNCKF